MARALYFQSRVLIQFWSECILTATYLINRTPSPPIQNKTPYEVLYNSFVDYSNFRVFGCLAFASTISAHRTKFQPRSCICILLGYPHGMKGYKMYDIQNKKIFISRDVIFHETKFSFHNMTDSNKIVDPFHDFVLPISSLEVPDICQHSHIIPNTEPILPDNLFAPSPIHSAESMFPATDSLNLDS